MQRSLNLMTESSDEDNTLVVYRKNRLATTSRLPERYVEDIRRIEGVVEVLPVQITVNNCGASLDVITFRGVPTDSLQSYNPNLEVISGSYAAWRTRSDARPDRKPVRQESWSRATSSKRSELEFG